MRPRKFKVGDEVEFSYPPVRQRGVVVAIEYLPSSLKPWYRVAYARSSDRIYRGFDLTPTGRRSEEPARTWKRNQKIEEQFGRGCKCNCCPHVSEDLRDWKLV